MKLNADLGEGMAFDEQLMPLLDMANIACGGHAGDLHSIRETLLLAKRHAVEVGAHPSYPDKENFGRISLEMSHDALLKSFTSQCQLIAAEANKLAMQLRYIKPHGALYNDMMRDDDLLLALIKAVASLGGNMGFMLLSTRRHAQHAAFCQQWGVVPIFEVFADRGYHPSGHLLPRGEQGALLSHNKALEQVRHLVKHGKLFTHEGHELQLRCESLCVHGDNPEALALTQSIRDLVR